MSLKYYNNNNRPILDEKKSSGLLLAILPIELQISKEKSNDGLVLPNDSSKPDDFFFQKNKIINSSGLDIFLQENKKKAVLNNSGYYIFVDFFRATKSKKFNLITLDNDSYLGTSHNLDLDLFNGEGETDNNSDSDGEDRIDELNSFPKRVALLYLSKKETIRNSVPKIESKEDTLEIDENDDTPNFAILIKSIITFTSYKEKKTKLQIYVYDGILDQLVVVRNERLLNSAEIYIKKLGSSLSSTASSPKEIFPEHDPNSNLYIYSNLDTEKSDQLEEITIQNLGTKKFIKFNDVADFELIVKYDGQETSFKLRLIDKTTTIINILILGGKK